MHLAGHHWWSCKERHLMGQHEKLRHSASTTTYQRCCNVGPTQLQCRMRFDRQLARTSLAICDCFLLPLDARDAPDESECTPSSTRSRVGPCDLVLAHVMFRETLGLSLQIVQAARSSASFHSTFVRSVASETRRTTVIQAFIVCLSAFLRQSRQRVYRGIKRALS